ncbi:MAG: FAD-dependent oxidoreductase [Ruminiclostridium sp.]|nr:FAD-dependent oxidoreductase [Ruminiclostridium sp.]
MEDMRNFKSLPNSYWIASTDTTDYPELQQDIAVDTLIVGGGMVGIITAYLLHKEGIQTAILEAGRIAMGTTAHTTAKITSQHGLLYDKIKNQRGLDIASQYAQANEMAIRDIKNISQACKIECDYLPQAAIVYTQQDKNVKKIEKEIKTASELGIKASWVDEIPFPITIKGGMKFEDQAQFHPRKFLIPLAEKVVSEGVQIYENTRAVDLEYGDKSTVITAQGKKITANRVIIASHYPFYNKHGMYYSRLYTERAYAIAFTAKEKYPGGMYINAEDPSRSLRFQPHKGGELMIAVGENHKTGQGEDMNNHYHELIRFADRVFTMKDLLYRWSTQDCMTLDGVPYVGRYQHDRPNLYVATGFEKWGMSNSMASAALLRDLIIKGTSPWQEVYDPSRKNIAGQIKTFIVENADLAKHLIIGKLAPIPENAEIQQGEGKVIEADGGRTGAYRDEKGKLHLVNTTCTHMGCELNWNSAERSWDCPCHGSRFTWSGEIIDGPAVDPLTAEQDVNTIEKLIKDEF